MNWLIELPVEGSRCLAVVQHNASQQGKAPFAIALTSTMGDFTRAEKADVHYIYGHKNGNGRASIRMYHS